jgi:capsular exopolysaccharide synthesis family protein
MNYEEKKKEVNLLDYWRMVVRRKGVIFAFTGVVVLLMGIRTFTSTPIYKAQATLMIEEEKAKMLSIENEFGYQSQVSDLRFFNTQLILLKSESLAERVARKLNLLSRPEFGAGKKPRKSLIAWIKDLLSFKWIVPKKKPKKEESGDLVPSNPFSGIAQSVRNSIEVSPIRETKVIKLSYSSPYPVLAAEIVNTLAQEFIAFSIEKRFETTQQASDFLGEQIVNLRDDLAAKERELQRYGKEKGLFFLNDSESTVVNKFADLNEAYTHAQIDRIKAEAIYRELKELKMDSLPQFVSDPAIQQLKAEYTRMKNEYEEKSRVYKSSHPEMVRLKAKMDSMKDELRHAVDAAESEYRSALKKEVSLRNLLGRQRSSVVKMNSNAILYKSLKIEVENKRKLLNSLVERQNETLVSARLGGLKTSSTSIIDRAKVPQSPISPRKKRNLILALLMGLFGGVGLCFFLDYMDNTIKGPEEVEKLVDLPSLGVIPFLPPDGMKKKKRYGYFTKYSYAYGQDNPQEKESLLDIKNIELINHLYPKFSISEDYRTARTSILLSHAERPPRTIAFSSASPKEGKTATVANMAVSFSQLEKKVLVVDSDMRKPRLHRLFKARNIGGLSGYLTGRISLEDAMLKTSIENIWMIPSGPIPPNPSELLNSNKMKEMIEETKARFDVVLLDTPPVMAVIDPVIISSLVDSTVFIVQEGKTAHKPFVSSIEGLRRAKANIVGVLFNEAKMRGDGYYHSSYSRYYRYHYYGGEEEAEE